MGSLLYDKTDEVEKVRGWRGQSSKVIVMARRGHSPKETYSYILRQVGKYETLNEEYLDAINWKIADERNMDIDRKHRLLKIREAFEKLME